MADDDTKTPDTAPADPPATEPTDGPVDPTAPGNTAPDDLKRLGYHEGRWHKTFSVAGELSPKQVEDCVHETLLQAQHGGYVADGNHPDIVAHTITGEDGAPTQVVVTVAVVENRIDRSQDAPADETPEG